MNKFTVEQVEARIAQFESELPDLDADGFEMSSVAQAIRDAMPFLRAFAERLREDAMDTKMLDFLDAHPKLIVRSGKQAIRPLILAAMHEQGEG